MFNQASNVNVFDGNVDLASLRNVKISIVAGKFNSFIVDHLVNGCIESLNTYGITQKQLELIYVPGAMEIPLAVQNVIKKHDIDGVVALGCVIRGATPHFDYVAGECASGLSRLSLEYNKPVGFGVLTTDTIEQAIERAGCKAGNKGGDAALAVISMINLINKIKVEQ